ncbi:MULTISPECIES: glycosyltransferase [Halomonadaceae]|uniref:Glycosyltransferase n=1 Tax=Vreelandella halophila TaxID=86177 RepID=A0A9X4Y9Z7_9GAMM|nr:MULTISPECIES: glycosyltransferase [Halomonas]MYL25268.1 glycosyltransferase [Halomonas utahensis]MYL75330.1 glycosyltransferase [Halomonas sp. 22501_18_FS]
MRIVIDMQGAQTEVQSNGAGHQAMAFAQAVVRNRGKNDVILALNGLLSHTIEPIRAAFDDVLPQEKIRIWYGPLEPLSGEGRESDVRRNVAELVREAFLASLDPDLVHISSFSLIEEGNAVASIGRFDTTTPVSVMLSRTDFFAASDKSENSRLNYDRFAPDKLQQLKGCAICTTLSEAGGESSLSEALLEDPHVRILELSTNTNQAAELDTQPQKLGSNYWERISHAFRSAVEQALAAWESLVQGNVVSKMRESDAKPRMAYVSPLPPEGTGIADYSAELLPALAEHYDITAITAEENLDTSRVDGQRVSVRGVAWFRRHASEMDRVIYHLGNSVFHSHMFSLIREIPGTVILHDFYLGDLMYWLEEKGGFERVWSRALYQDHGYKAFRAGSYDVHAGVKDYPVNFEFLKKAVGIISHSEYSKELAGKWYQESVTENWSVIPHLRSAIPKIENGKRDAKTKLGFSEQDLVVCCFGVIGPTKCNKAVVESWLNANLANDPKKYLIFVGQDNDDRYSRELKQIIKKNGLKDKVRITGFASHNLFHQYLDAADLAVQLRTLSRGETSGTVLDCMNHGVPVVVNANGSMSELDQDSVWMLPDDFGQGQLQDALMVLIDDEQRREAMVERAREVLVEQHDPKKCAGLYHQAIEQFYGKKWDVLESLIRRVSEAKDSDEVGGVELTEIAESIAWSLPEKKPCSTLYVDISATCRNDLGTGIERVARALVLAMFEISENDVRVEPVYLDFVNGQWRHRLASRYTLNLIECPWKAGNDEIISPQSGDVLVGLDLCGIELVQAQKQGLFDNYRDLGIPVYFMVHDLLPVRMPEVFPKGAGEVHEEWLYSLSTFDGIIGVTETVAEDYSQWLQEHGIEYSGRRPFLIFSSHHGADVGSSAPSRGLARDAGEKLAKITARPSFLMVGTIEPRKGCLEVINAFSSLWEQGVEANLVIVGNEGWKELPEEERRDIPETIRCLRNHPETDRHLFWLEGISDEYLEEVYAASSCLIAASYGEGFGLPLIEAAQHGMPIIARNIRVFREVAGNHAFYFNNNGSEELADAIKEWLELYQEGGHPRSDEMPWRTWKKSAQNLMEIALHKKKNSSGLKKVRNKEVQ